jgi:hypothetical protein
MTGLTKMLAVDCSMTCELKTHEVNLFFSNGSHFNFKTSTSDIYMLDNNNKIPCEIKMDIGT